MPGDRGPRRAAAALDGRVFHAKTLAALEGVLLGAGDLPAWAGVGLFASARAWPVLVRFSNGAGRALPDWLPDVRGLAVRVLVDPPKRVQDFLAINQRRFPVRRPEPVEIVARHRGHAARLALALLGAVPLPAAMRAAAIVAAGLLHTTRSLATETYSTIQPLAMAGETALLRFVPSAPRRHGLPSRDLGGELAARLREGAVELDLVAHRFVDERSTPTEDPTRAWRLAPSSGVTLARLTMPAVDLASAASRSLRREIEGLAFSPWHCLAEHSPRGPLATARRLAYAASAAGDGSPVP
jgi:hypothetical protein